MTSCASWGRQLDVEWFFTQLGVCFDIKPPTYLSKDNMLDHLGMVLLKDRSSVYLLMQNYIKVMAIKLSVDIEGCKLRCTCTHVQAHQGHDTMH